MRTQLLGSREIAERTMAFELERPSGFSFQAGQSLDLRLVAPKETDAEGDKRSFSIVSAPFAERLEVATRLRDTAFKRVLRSLAAGSSLELDGPFGSMTLHKAANRPAVMVAGGIGITPFISMLRQAAAGGSDRAFVLITSNRRPEDAPYRQELERLSRRLKHMRFLPTMTQAERSAEAWAGRRGKVDAAWLRDAVPELPSAVCYAAGPPGMVAAMKSALLAAGADEDSIRTEDFQGY